MISRYKVIIMPNARDDLVKILDNIAEISRFAGSVKKWNDKILDVALSLEYMPERFSVSHIGAETRLARAGKYALLYRVDKENKRVLIMRIVYARRDLKKVDMDDGVEE